jgi:tetratricopeptide (TPR) repeat protein
MKKNIFYLLTFVLFVCACKTEVQKDTIIITGNPVIDDLNKKIAENPKEDSLYAMRAAAYYKDNIYDQAIKDMAKALSIDSTNAAYHHILADIYMDNNDSRMALRTMERIVSIHPERIPSLLKLAEVQFIVAQYKPSIETTAKVLQLDPQNAEGFFMQGRNLAALNEKERAAAAYKKCTSLDAEHIDGWVELGHLLNEKKDPAALQYFQTAQRIDSTDVPAIFGEATFYTQKNQLDKAIEVYKKAIAIDHQNADAMYNIGLLSMDLKKFKEAKDNFNICTQVDPQYVMGFFYRGVCNEELGLFAEAKKDYEQTVTLSPNFERGRKALEKVQLKIQ